MKGDDICDRLLDLGAASLVLATRIAMRPGGKHLANQLIRCSGSAGANYEEARSAESRADFIHKIGIASKEARETLWWLLLAERTKLVPSSEVAQAIREARELVAILIASKVTARANDSP